jgi:hypothetical protein
VQIFLTLTANTATAFRLLQRCLREVAGGLRAQFLGGSTAFRRVQLTKRAKEQDPMSSVGRIFSAQMTPPCASTICFENRQSAGIIAKLRFGSFGVKALEYLAMRPLGCRVRYLQRRSNAVFAFSRPYTDRVALFAERNRIDIRINETQARRPSRPI